MCVTSQRWPPVVQLSLDEQREDAAVEDAMFRLAEAAHLLVSREKLLKTLAYVMLLLSDARLSPHYQLELDKEGALDTLSLKVEPRPEGTTIDPARLSAELQETVKQRLGVSIAVWVQEPGTLQRSEGKAVRLLDLRRKS